MNIEATLWDFRLLVCMNLTPRSVVFTWMSRWTWCCSPWSSLWSSLACQQELDATLHDFQLRVYVNLMLRSVIFQVRRCKSRAHEVPWFSKASIFQCYVLHVPKTFPDEGALWRFLSSSSKAQVATWRIRKKVLPSKSSQVIKDNFT